MAGLPEEWRIGILFSQRGLSMVTEAEHIRGTILAIEAINAAGGVRGRPLAPVMRDPESDPRLYREKARELLVDEGVNVILGCSHSASRKAVLPLIERHNGLLLYPSMYEGFEYSENVIYTGATLNQIGCSLADYLVRNHGRRIFLCGADYIFSRESNRVMRDLLEARGASIVGERHVPLAADTGALRGLIDDVRAAAPDVVFATIIGGPAREFYRMYAEAGFDPRERPIASLTMAETEIGRIGPEACVGHILSSSYFQTIDSPANAAFVAAFRSRFGDGATTSTWSANAYTQTRLLALALEQAGTLETEALSQAFLGQQVIAPEGPVRVDAETRHLWLTPRIGVVREGGLFDIRWQAPAPLRPDPYLATVRFDESWIEA